MENQENINGENSQILINLISGLKEADNPESEIFGFIRFVKPFVILLFVPLIFYVFYSLLLISTPLLQNGFVKLKPGLLIDNSAIRTNQKPFTLASLEQKSIKPLEKSYAKFSNIQAYLVINTTENKFALNNKGKIVRQGKCSTGSYILLYTGDERKWKFETPKGLFRIHGKAESPVWNKPDWAFIEEGLPVPPSYSHLRWESGVLGDYALSIGDGYLIHGTLYKRLLGMPVTHGCVRMDDEDLEAVFNTLRVGSKVYIF